MNTPLIRKRSPWDLGTWLWLLNRIAGVIVIVYLIVHICVISSTQMGASTFDGIMASLHSPGALAFELVLAMAVLAHAANGLRHILIDFGLVAPRHHKALFVVAAIICMAVFVAAVRLMWPFISAGH